MKARLALTSVLMVAGVTTSCRAVSWCAVHDSILQQSELVVVGKTGAAQLIWDEVYTTDGGQEIPAQRYIVPVAVECVLKGKDVPAQLTVAYFNYRPRPGAFSGPGFATVPSDATCILCLVHDRDKDHRLTKPMSTGNLVPVGRAMPAPADPPQSVAEAVVEQLLYSAAADDLPVDTRRCCTGALIGIEFHLCPPASGAAPESAASSPERMRQLLQERVLPTLLELTLSREPELVRMAWVTLAYMQYPGAVPPIVEMARNDPTAETHASAAWRLEAYRCSSPELTRLLNPLLRDKDHRIREAVAYALRQVGDQSSIAYLLDALDDTEWRIRWYAVQALSRVTGEGVFPARDYFQDKEAEFIQFWKDWAANHPDQVKKE